LGLPRGSSSGLDEGGHLMSIAVEPRKRHCGRSGRSGRQHSACRSALAGCIRRPLRCDFVLRARVGIQIAVFAAFALCAWQDPMHGDAACTAAAPAMFTGTSRDVDAVFTALLASLAPRARVAKLADARDSKANCLVRHPPESAATSDSQRVA